MPCPFLRAIAHQARRSRRSSGRGRSWRPWSGPTLDPKISSPSLSDVYGALALALEDAGRREEALAAYRRARDLGESLFRANPKDPETGHELARNLGNMGICLAGSGRPSEALAAFDRRGRSQDLGGRQPDPDPNPRGLGLDRYLRRRRPRRARADDEALEALGRARAARETLIKANPPSRGTASSCSGPTARSPTSTARRGG